MKKIISLLLVIVTAVMGISCTAVPAVEADANKEGAAQIIYTPLPSPYPDQNETVPSNTEPPANIQNGSLPSNTEPSASVQDEPTEVAPVEKDYFNPDIPLTYEEQNLLRNAAEEFGVPYELALALIEKETDFRNVIGDDGASIGYMQVAAKWHRDRMERLGVTNLFDPDGNFRVGLDFLSELYDKYSDWGMALTVYNMGHDPGYITIYANDVLSNYIRWQELIENYE